MPGLEVRETTSYDHHHPLSHHEGKKGNLDKVSKIDRLNIEQFAYLVSRMKSLKEGPGTLLDNVIFTWCNGHRRWHVAQL